jgi:type I restriction enzyme S subunit
MIKSKAPPSDKWEPKKLGDIASIEHSRIDPSAYSETEFQLFSFSAHDDGKVPEPTLGKNIGSKKYELQPGCVLVSKLNPRIQRVWVPTTIDDYSICSTEFVVLVPQDGCPREFLYAVCSSPQFQAYLEKMVTGTSSSHQRVKQSDIMDYEFQMPTEEYARRIGDVYTTFEEKISINDEIIATLDSMLQETYRSFSLNNEEEAPFDAIAEFVDGRAFDQKEWKESGEPIIKISELNGGIGESTDYFRGDVDSVYELSKGDVLFAWSASLGAYFWDRNEGLLNQHIFKVLPDEEFTKPFLYIALKGEMQRFKNAAHGTTTKHINRSDMSEITLTVGEVGSRKEVMRKIQPLYERMVEASAENHTLRDMKETILPQMLSPES